MKVVDRVAKVKELPRFSGRVKVVVSGFDQHSVLMSGKQGLPARSFIVIDVTLDEVYSVVRKAVERVCEDG